MPYAIFSRLVSLLFLAVLLVVSIDAVRDGEALWAHLYGIVLGLWLGGYVVEFLLWRKRRRTAKTIIEGLTADSERLRVLE